MSNKSQIKALTEQLELLINDNIEQLMQQGKSWKELLHQHEELERAQLADQKAIETLQKQQDERCILINQNIDQQGKVQQALQALVSALEPVEHIVLQQNPKLSQFFQLMKQTN